MFSSSTDLTIKARNIEDWMEIIQLFSTDVATITHLTLGFEGHDRKHSPPSEKVAAEWRKIMSMEFLENLEVLTWGYMCWACDPKWEPDETTGFLKANREIEVELVDVAAMFV
ncbi:hypothetical protein P7C70_g6090, partial [Phenoliferia sp. Uapishka_3]